MRSKALYSSAFSVKLQVRILLRTMNKQWGNNAFWGIIKFFFAEKDTKNAMTERSQNARKYNERMLKVQWNHKQWIIVFVIETPNNICVMVKQWQWDIGNAQFTLSSLKMQWQTNLLKQLFIDSVIAKISSGCLYSVTNYVSLAANEMGPSEDVTIQGRAELALHHIFLQNQG